MFSMLLLFDHELLVLLEHLGFEFQHFALFLEYSLQFTHLISD